MVFAQKAFAYEIMLLRQTLRFCCVHELRNFESRYSLMYTKEKIRGFTKHMCLMMQATAEAG